jgi:Spy/CpxP family protein refolding chaperone
MRKSILMGLSLAAAMAGTAVAQQGSGHEDHGGWLRDTSRARFDRRGGGSDGFLFRGITLTDAQKTQLAALRTTQRDRIQTRRDSVKKEFAAIREARQRGDTAAARAQALKLRQAMAQAREAHLTAVRNVLTAEQRVQFEKNVSELEKHRSEPKQRKPGDGRRSRR